MNLILLDRREVGDSGDLTLTDARAAHLLKVLNAAPGRVVRVGLIDGPIGTGVVTAACGGAVTMRCEFVGETAERPRVDLLLALPRPKVMRRLWPQLAALGVGRIILTNAARVERPYFDTHVLEETHYRALLIEGLQQARDTRLPLVSVHRQLKVLVEDRLDALVTPDAGTARLVADPAGTDSIGAIATERRAAGLLIAVGPEGGWNDFERGLFQRHGFAVVGIGARTLRSDTACIALLALAHGAISGGR